MKFKIIDLFAGCGGMSLGFQQAGFEILSAYEIWDPAILIYNKNFNHPILRVDLSNISDFSIFLKHGKPDLIIGGPPCQDFSSAGKRDENGGRANLTLSYANIVKNVQPNYFVMENVSTIRTSNTLKEAKQIFINANYGLTEIVLNASNCGVPQDRKRYFLVGELGGVENFLNKTIEKNVSKTKLTVREYLGTTFNTEFYYRHPRSYMRRAIYSIDEPSATIRGVNRPVPKTYKPHENDATKDLSKVRALTTEERALIQTFPKEFMFVGPKNALEQIIGNAVPVNLAKLVASCLLEYINKKVR
jgi:DNA (cytosine-5)-methyltransferase 1